VTAQVTLLDAVRSAARTWAVGCIPGPSHAEFQGRAGPGAIGSEPPECQWPAGPGGHGPAAWGPLASPARAGPAGQRPIPSRCSSGSGQGNLGARPGPVTLTPDSQMTCDSDRGCPAPRRGSTGTSESAGESKLLELFEIIRNIICTYWRR
jgi:hypothetical protein